MSISKLQARSSLSSYDEDTEKFELSKMINPDGSVTVRSLLNQEDGTWVIEEDVYDDNSNNQRYDCDQYADNAIPSLTFESSSSSDTTDKSRSKLLPFMSTGGTRSLSFEPVHHSETTAPFRSTPFTLTRPKPIRLEPIEYMRTYSSQEVMDRMIDRKGFLEAEKIKKKNGSYHSKGKFADKHSFSSVSSEESSVFQDVIVSHYDKDNIDEILGRLEDQKVHKQSLIGVANGVSYPDEDPEDYNPIINSVTVYKNSQEDKIGIYVGLQNFHFGARLVISKIASGGKFVTSVIKVGDIVISINGENMEENPSPERALNIVNAATGRVTIITQKIVQKTKSDFVSNKIPEKNDEETKTSEVLVDIVTLSEKLIDDGNMLISKDSKITEPVPILTETAGTVGTTKSAETTTNSLKDEHVEGKFEPTKKVEFNDKAYVAPLYGYNSSNSVKVMKEYPNQDVGFETRETVFNWGNLLTVSRIKPFSIASTTLLNVGDVILTINGVDFRKTPDAEKASSLMKYAQREVYIEYQKIYSYFPTVLVDASDRPIQAEIKAYNRDAYSEESEKDHLIKSGFESRESRGECRKSSMKTKGQKIWITVMRGKQRTIGINFATCNNKLMVTKVSSSGLLRKAPIVPGDTILSINKVDFRCDPNAKKAFMLVKSSSKKLIFEILKTEYEAEGKKKDVITRSCVLGSFPCVARK